jgi:hypothetical protein
MKSGLAVSLLRIPHPRGMRTWTRQTAAQALTDWMREHGRQPTFGDFDIAPPGCPSRPTLQKLFGSWAAAVEAAGGVALRRGIRRRVVIQVAGEREVQHKDTRREGSHA